MLGNIDLQGIGGPLDTATWAISQYIPQYIPSSRQVRQVRAAGDPVGKFFSEGNGALILAVVAGIALLLISKPDKTGSIQTPKLSAIKQIEAQIEALKPKIEILRGEIKHRGLV